MKLLITHKKDIDGLTPIILLKLLNIKFDFILLDIGEINECFAKLFELKIFNNYEEVFITDLSLSCEIYNALIAQQITFKIFDHHENSLNLGGSNVYVDMFESGTSLFYNFLINDYKKLKTKKIKQLVSMVKAVDLWDHNNSFFGDGQNLSNILDIFGRKYYVMFVYNKLKHKKNLFNKLDLNLLQVEKVRIDNYIEKKKKNIIFIQIDEYQIGVVFAGSYRSELGNRLAQIYSNLDFIIIININGGISYRTQGEVDLNAFACRYNGGGHKKASGSPLPSDLKQMIITKIFSNAVFIEKETKAFDIYDKINNLD